MTPETAVMPIEASEVAVALRASQPQKSRSSGTMTKPPPTPNGALAPIVSRPEDARVTDPTREELRRLNESYALVACISGRAGEDARSVVGVPELVYVGNHGLELE